jgi:hypothetical protein
MSAITGTTHKTTRQMAKLPKRMPAPVEIAAQPEQTLQSTPLYIAVQVQYPVSTSQLPLPEQSLGQISVQWPEAPPELHT